MPEITVMLGENEVHRYFVDKDVISVGRSRDNDIIIENLAVSRNHARIRQADGQFILTDLNSANGTFVNGVKVNKTEIVDGDTITVGKHKLRFSNTELSDEALIGDAFGADRTMIVDRTPEAKLVVVKGKQKGQEFKITKAQTQIGRSSSDNDICIHDWFVSRRHALVLREGQQFFVKDTGSWKGTILNDQHVKESPLSNDDVLKLGTTTLRFTVVSPDEIDKIEGRMPVELGMDDHVDLSQESPVGGPGMDEGVNEPASAAADALDQADEQAFDVVLPPKANEVLGDSAEPDARAPEPVFEIDLSGSAPPGSEEEVAAAAASPSGSRQPVGIAPAPGPATKPAPAAMGAGEEKGDASPARSAPTGDEALDHEVALWERALRNPSPVVQREAVRMLKKLTGRDYGV